MFRDNASYFPETRELATKAVTPINMELLNYIFRSSKFVHALTI